MTPRVKWLLVGGLVVVGLYFMDSLYRKWIEQPNQQLTAQLEDLNEKLNASRTEQLIAQKQGKRLESFAARALPDDPQLARSLYQQWLLNLVEASELTSASVDAAQPVRVEIRSRTKKGSRQAIGYRINYSLRGKATLAKLSAFLNDFRKAGHLHKIRSITLNPIGNEGRLDADLTIEVLCLKASANKDRLSDWQATDEATVLSSTYDDFVRRNLFARGFAKALFEIELKAITSNREGVLQAWFRIDGRGTTKTIAAGGQIPVALHDISVLEVLNNKVFVRVNEDTYWIKLGQTIGEVCSLKPEGSLGEIR
ncbi:MAG: hypothetical protein WCK15_19645 [Pirellula sp.]